MLAGLTALLPQTCVARPRPSHPPFPTFNALNAPPDLGALAEASVADLGFVTGRAGVVTVSPDTPALDAMVLMEDRNISAVAVVGADGAIIGNFSISELR